MSTNTGMRFVNSSDDLWRKRHIETLILTSMYILRIFKRIQWPRVAIILIIMHIYCYYVHILLLYTYIIHTRTCLFVSLV